LKRWFILSLQSDKYFENWGGKYNKNNGRKEHQKARLSIKLFKTGIKVFFFFFKAGVFKQYFLSGI